VTDLIFLCFSAVPALAAAISIVGFEDMYLVEGRTDHGVQMSALTGNSNGRG
jgi:hypothetical protein